MKHIGLLVSLLLSILFLSCDKDSPVPDNPTTGEEVFIQIRALEIAEGDDSDLTRAAALRESETEYIPNGDGLFVKMSMEENETESLRAEKTLTTGAWFRVVAVKSGTGIYISHGDFQQGGATTVADFHVTTNADYDIYCFSYNNTTNTLPAFNPARYDDISNIALSGDLENLLWQKQTIHVDDAAPSLSFLLNYKAARVRVVVDCGYNNWTITGIANTMQLSSVSVAQSVNLMSGDPSGDSAGNKTVAWSISGEGTEQTSNPLIVMPTATSTTLTVTLPIDVIVRKSPLYPIPTESVYNGKFTTTLQAGHSYKLFVKLKAPKFAGSNIYFDKNSVPNGPQLIFDEHGDNTHQGYQGLFFRFGSLRGISPAGAFVANSTAVYYILAPSTAASYDAIQYWDLATHGSTPIPEGNCHVEPHVGDICACIRYGYRLPKPTEFGIGGSTAFNTSTPVAGGWVKGSGSFGSYNAAGNGYEDGTANLLTTANGASAAFGSAYNRTMNITLPASGYRTPYGLVDVGLNGQYWGGTQSSDIYAPRMGFNSSEIYTQGGTGRDYAHTVRCVKAD